MTAASIARAEPWIDFLTAGAFDYAWLLAAVALLLLAIGFVLSALFALLRLRPFSFVFRVVFGAALLVAGALAAVVAVGTAGYQALTHEEVAATIRVEPSGPQRFTAIVRLPDGRSERFDLAGDEIYVDAHILKWKSIANRFGLHTAYELDRIAGRYQALKDEQSQPRTVHALAAPKPLDLFTLRRRYVALAPLLDADYGSASFVTVTHPVDLEVRVSNTGLLIRERPKQ
ncbi:MAG TPA: hypothetical protein VMK32_13210 [Burkholderiaceae bacterium]|nr:hypothetical protein [Burkholderiaceae bacterium]